METVDASHMRTMNSTTLLRMIWQEQEISRADISRMTGMSRSSVSTIVAELLERDLVSEQGVRHSTSGRRPMMLSFHSDAYSIIGVDVGATHVAFASVRMEPPFMIMSESAAHAIDLALKEGKSVQEIDLAQLHDRLVKAGQLL